jgi:exopolyphosphatase / guanosine-5'-triphosphate,3'-diphosphate pyrophosphatase
MDRRIATIDVGTNTTLLLVARATPEIEVLAERAEITRLGRGIGSSGQLAADGIAATLAVLRDYAGIARGLGADIAAVGTEALRRAHNAADFLAPAEEVLGSPIEVIDGEREAALTFRAVLSSFPDARRGRLVVVDIGGGSTEVVMATDGRVDFQTSAGIGSVRLTEQFVRHDPASDDDVAAVRRAAGEALATVPFSATGPLTLVGVAGTVTSLAAMAQDLASYDPARVHGYQLSRGELARQIDRLRAADQAARERMPGLDPRRADVILAGALILDCIAELAGAAHVRVSDRGIRWGLIYELLGSGGP